MGQAPTRDGSMQPGQAWGQEVQLTAHLADAIIFFNVSDEQVRAMLGLEGLLVWQVFSMEDFGLKAVFLLRHIYDLIMVSFMDLSTPTEDLSTLLRATEPIKSPALYPCPLHKTTGQEKKQLSWSYHSHAQIASSRYELCTASTSLG